MILKTVLSFIGWPLSIGTSFLPHGPHITRYAMYRRLSELGLEQAQGTGKKVLSISHSNRLLAPLSITQADLTEANYPEHNAVKLTAFDDNSFDYVLSDMVLEHVEGSPYDVFSETLRILKPGGICVHTTCFVHPIHGYPSDYWRFSPACLRMLAKNFSEIIDVGGFGNRAFWIIDILGLRGTPIPHAKWHPMHWIATWNMKAWPVSVWIVARK